MRLSALLLLLGVGSGLVSVSLADKIRKGSDITTAEPLAAPLLISAALSATAFLLGCVSLAERKL